MQIIIYALSSPQKNKRELIYLCPEYIFIIFSPPIIHKYA